MSPGHTEIYAARLCRTFARSARRRGRYAASTHRPHSNPTHAKPFRNASAQRLSNELDVIRFVVENESGPT
jgi:hypothetical protein